MSPTVDLSTMTMLFMDLQMNEILDGYLPVLSSSALCGIDSTNPHLCITYIEALLNCPENMD
jgi:hypothetical protein